MNIRTVKSNLKKMLAGKEAHLEEVRKARSHATMAEDVSLISTQKFLEISIQELKNTLQVLDQCYIDNDSKSD